MSCNEIPTCNPCNPPYTEVGCIDYPPTGCVIYNGEDIPCLNIEKSENLNDVLQHLKDIICGLSPASYEEFDYGCFSSEGISTEQEFVEFITGAVCSILGTQDLGDVTSLSSLYTLIQTLTTNLNLIKNQTLISCFQTLSGLSTPQTISNLLTSVQTILCDHEDRIVALEVGGGLSITTVNTNKNVAITASGTANHTLTAAVVIDPDAANAITTSNAGLKVLSPDITVTDTQSVNFTASGTKNHTITADVKISGNAGNAVSIASDGLFVNPASIGETALVATDSTSIDFTTSGTNGHNLTAAVKLDPSLLNIAQITGSGLFVSSGLTQTDITPVDSQSIDLTVSGANNHTLRADVKISPNAGNNLVLLSNGLYSADDESEVAWGLLGNTAASNNFLGTINNQPLNFKVNNTNSGKINTTGIMLLGYQSGLNNVSTKITGFGYRALIANTTGAANTAVGANSLEDNVIGSNNTAIGELSLTNSTESDNTAVGNLSLTSMITGTGNTAVGAVAGSNTNIGSELDGDYNTFIGYGAKNSTGFPTISNSVAIGKNATVKLSNTMVLGGTGADSVTIVAGDTSGDASAKLDLVSTSQGLLPPRMTTTQKNAIVSPAAGLILYDITLSKLQCYDGSIWNSLF